MYVIINLYLRNEYEEKKKGAERMKKTIKKYHLKQEVKNKILYILIICSFILLLLLINIIENINF